MATYSWTPQNNSTDWSAPNNWTSGTNTSAGPPPTNNSATLSIPGGSTIKGIPNGFSLVTINFTSPAGAVSLTGSSFTSAINIDTGFTVPSGYNLTLSNMSITSSSAIGGAGTITLNGAKVDVTGGTAVTENFYFDHVSSGNNGNVLILPSYYTTVTLQNLGYGDQIQTSAVNGGTVTFVPNGTFNGVQAYKLEVNGAVVYSTVTLDTTGTGAISTDFQVSGGFISYDGPAYCFLTGTRLATPDGEIAVEDITAGTMLLTASGEAKPVRWLGRSVVATQFADRLTKLPIRIKAGALGENQPICDLLVSPCHAMFIDGILVHAGALVNGTSITRETDMPATFNYYHVELATHELLLAEGAPAESFIDNVDRMAFQNWAEHEAIANPQPIEEMPYPRAKSYRQVPMHIRRMLAGRAAPFEPAKAA